MSSTTDSSDSSGSMDEDNTDRIRVCRWTEDKSNTRSDSSGSKDEDNIDTERISVCRWSEDKSNTPAAATWCLIDHPNIWSQYFDREMDFSNSSRLSSLIQKPKNVIVQLPDAMDVARRFFCHLCDEIPFPWNGDPDAMMEENQPYPEGVFLCENGHTVCRSCIHNNENCTSCEEELSYLLNGSTSDLPSLSMGNFELEPAQGCSGEWGLTEFCFAPLTLNICPFLTDMIIESEFACQYFYNWCDFRGSGQDLRDHESQCDHRPTEESPQSQPETKDKLIDGEIQSVIDDDDENEAAILTFDLDAAIAETAQLLESLIPDWDSKNPRNNTIYSQRKKRISKPKIVPSDSD